MSYRVATTNAHAPSSAAKNRQTINAAAARCDVLKVQEADSQVIAAMRDLKGWSTFIPTGLGIRNPIAWRADKFELVTSGSTRIMANRPGVKDGPDRSMVWVVLREKATGRLSIEVNVHLIHQAFTSHRERQPSWRTSLAKVGEITAVLVERHRAPAIISGDWNNPGAFKIPGVVAREVSSPATFGKRRYDRFFIVGNATASAVNKLITPSDHDTLIATITLGAQVTPKPTPKPEPQPEDPMKRITLGRDTSGRPLVVDSRTLAKLRAAEAALGFKFTIVQGSYRGSGGAAASAGTHDKGGVVDLRTWNLPPGITPQEAVRALREAGLIAWYRTTAQGFDPHIHAIDYGNPDLAPSAARQVTAWEAGRNGLASNGRDDGPRITIPKNPPAQRDWFDMATEADLRRIVREEVNKAIGDVGEDVAKELLPGMDDAPKGRWLGSAISNIHNAVLRIEKKVEAKR